MRPIMAQQLLESHLYFEKILGMFQKFHGVRFDMQPVKGDLKGGLMLLIMQDPYTGKAASMTLTKRMYFFLTGDNRETCSKFIDCLHDMRKHIQSQK